MPVNQTDDFNLKINQLTIIMTLTCALTTHHHRSDPDRDDPVPWDVHGGMPAHAVLLQRHRRPLHAHHGARAVVAGHDREQIQ